MFNIQCSIIFVPNQPPLCELLEAAEGVDVEPRLLHDVAVGDAADRLVADGAAGRHLAPRADAFEVSPDVHAHVRLRQVLAVQSATRHAGTL